MRRAILRNKARHQHLSRPVHEVKSTSVRIGDPRCSFDDQPVKIRGAKVFRERFPQSVEKIEDPVLFNLQFFPRPLSASIDRRCLRFAPTSTMTVAASSPMSRKDHIESNYFEPARRSCFKYSRTSLNRARLSGSASTRASCASIIHSA